MDIISWQMASGKTFHRQELDPNLINFLRACRLKGRERAFLKMAKNSNIHSLKMSIFLPLIFLVNFLNPAPAFTESAKNPKAGQFCAAKEAGLKVVGLICKKSGIRYRWSH
jgi:hypothetical protein